MKKPNSIKEALRHILTKKQLALMPASFDTLGNIIIFNKIPEELKIKEKQIGEEILKLFPNVTTICKKTGKYSGTFRTPKLKIIAGKRKKETTYKENNSMFLLHPENTYFSARLSTERKRIAELVRPNEDILVMFSGVAPYPIVISRNTKARHITGIEINPDAHKYALKNLELNKIKNITLLNADVKKAVPKLKKHFDRILMPLPKSAEDFLDIALSASKKGTTIHFYDFLHEDEFDLAKEKIKNACKINKKRFKILRTVKCGQHSPRVFRICVDFQIL